MTKKILVIMGHPAKKSLNREIFESYIKGAEKTGAEVRKIDLGKIKFDPVLHEGYNEKQELELDLVKAQKDILWCNHLVVVYPTWWDNVPAVLKGFIDRVFLPGFAFKYHKGKLLPEKLLKGRSARVIATAGVPWWYYFFMRHNANRSLNMLTLRFVGFSPVKFKTFFKIRKISDERAKKILEEVERLGMRDAK